MPALVVVALVWAVITIAFVHLFVYRRSLTKKATNRIPIPLARDSKEDEAARAQSTLQMKTGKVDLSIFVLGTISLILLVVVGMLLISNWFRGLTWEP